MQRNDERNDEKKDLKPPGKIPPDDEIQILTDENFCVLTVCG